MMVQGQSEPQCVNPEITVVSEGETIVSYSSVYRAAHAEESVKEGALFE